MYSACLIARRAPIPPSQFRAMSPTAANNDSYVLVDRVEDTKIRLLKAGQTCEFMSARSACPRRAYAKIWSITSAPRVRAGTSWNR